jgi:hypothetical protein
LVLVYYCETLGRLYSGGHCGENAWGVSAFWLGMKTPRAMGCFAIGELMSNTFTAVIHVIFVISTPT